MNARTLLVSVVGLLAAGLATPASSQISYSSLASTYSQDFDSLGTTGGTWVDNVTLPGWYASGFGGAYLAASATDNKSLRGLYSFGTGTERALGAFNVQDGKGSTKATADSIYFGFGLRNDTGSTIDSFTLSLGIERYEQSGGNDATAAAWRLGGSFASETGWTAATQLDLTDGKTTKISYSNTGFSWAPGETLWFRWEDVDSNGLDRSLAIDNLGFSALSSTAVVPEPSTYAIALGLGAMAVAILRRWRR